MDNNKAMVPGAIIIAGLLIAGAVFYNGRDNTAPAQPSNGGGGQEISVREVSSEDHILGNPDAPVKIVEYSDIDCPFCSRFHVTMHEVVEAYDGQVAWVYRHLPLAQLHPLASAKAEATECVAELGGNDAFWAFLDTLFEREGEAPVILANESETETRVGMVLEVEGELGATNKAITIRYKDILEGNIDNPVSIVVKLL